VTAATEKLPLFARGLCDDAAVFPPGLSPLPDAVAAHRTYLRSSFRDLAGPLVLAAPALNELAPLLRADEALQLAVTAPEGPAQLATALSTAGQLPVQVVAAEVAVPGVPETFFEKLNAVSRPGLTTFVEVPRDERRAEVIAGCARHGYPAKFRTGGVRAELYPDEAELSKAIVEVASAGVPFKATAGLHHALRNTDPDTGFEQHGFLNLLLATDAAVRGANAPELAQQLAERDGSTITEAIRRLDDARISAARRAFVSFGTCSIVEPLDELVELELIPAAFGQGPQDA
jgi:hypothetical protein